MQARHIFFLIFLLSAFLACTPEANFPKEPVLSKPSYTLIKQNPKPTLDSLVRLKFYFTDGDGDVGLDQNDTLTTDGRNLFIDYFENKNGQWSKVLVGGTGKDTLNYNSRITNLGNTPGLQIQGEISTDINVVFAGSDSIMFKYYLTDLAGHKSNTLSSGLITIKRQ